MEAGDGTTSVVVLAGSLLHAAEKMLHHGRSQTSSFPVIIPHRLVFVSSPYRPRIVGIHPTVIAESFQRATEKATEILTGMSTKLDLSDRDSLLKSASTSLNSKVGSSWLVMSSYVILLSFPIYFAILPHHHHQVVSQYSGLLAPIAVDAVMQVIDPATATNVDLNDIRCVTKVGGTIDDTELVNGVVLTQSALKSAGGPARMEKAKIGIIQFQLSPPKPDVRFNGALILCSCALALSIPPSLFPPFPRLHIATPPHRWTTKSWSTITARWTRS